MTQGPVPPAVPGGAQPGPAVLSPGDERTWAMLAHLSPFAGSLVGFPVLGPLVVYLVYKDRSAFVRRHAAAALNFQLLLLIVAVVSIPVAIVVGVLTLGIGLLLLIPVLIVLAVASVILQVLAAVAANRGQEYRYPWTPALVT